MDKRSNALTISQWRKILYAMAFASGMLLAVIIIITVLLVSRSDKVYAGSGNYTSNQSMDDVHYRVQPAQWYTHVEERAGALDGTYYKYGCGMIFRDIEADQGDSILEAYITFVADRNCAGVVCNTRLSAENVDNAVTFNNSASDYLARYGNNTDTIDWDAMAPWTSGNTYQTGNLTFIQDIIDRDGWEAGNNICIFWEDYDDRSSDGAERIAESWDTDVSKRPILYIEYQESETCPTEVENFSIVEGSSGEITAVWTYPSQAGVDYVTIRGGYTSYPASNITGFLIYSGTVNQCSINEYYNEYEDLYLSAFAVNGGLGCSSNGSNTSFRGDAMESVAETYMPMIISVILIVVVLMVIVFNAMILKSIIFGVLGVLICVAGIFFSEEIISEVASMSFLVVFYVGIAVEVVQIMFNCERW